MKITTIWKTFALILLLGGFFQYTCSAQQSGNSYNPVVSSSGSWDNASVSGFDVHNTDGLNTKSGNEGVDIVVDSNGKANVTISGAISYDDHGISPGDISWIWKITGGKTTLSGTFSGQTNVSESKDFEIEMDGLCGSGKTVDFVLDASCSTTGATPASQAGIFSKSFKVDCDKSGSEVRSIHTSFELGSGGCCGANDATLKLDWTMSPVNLITKRCMLALSGLSYLQGCVVDGISGPRPIDVSLPNVSQPGDGGQVDSPYLGFNQRSGMYIRQILTKSVLIDLQDLPGGTGYVLNYYTAAQTSKTVDPATRLYPISGDPFKTITVENPGGDINIVRIARADAGSVRVSVEEFFWDTAANDWSLREGYNPDKTPGHDIWLRTTRLKVISDNGRQRVERREVSLDGTNGMASVTETTYDMRNPSGKVPLKEVLDPGDSSHGNLTSTWTYFGGGAGAYTCNYSGRLQSTTKYDGYWETYQYDDQRRPISVVSQYDNSSFNDNANSKQIVYTFGQNSTDETENTKIGANLMSWRSLNRQSSIDTNTKTAQIESSQGETLRDRVQTGRFVNRVARDVKPGGITSLYNYTANDDGGETTDERSGMSDDNGVTVAGGVRTITTKSKEGEVIGQVKQDLATGATIENWHATGLDGRGRPTAITYYGPDGTTVLYKIFKTYDCCGLASETDRDGIVTEYEYDSLKRVTCKTRLGLRELTQYDAADHVIIRKRESVSGSATVILEQNTYDLAGRLTKSVAFPGDPILCGTTTIGYSYGTASGGAGTTVTTTYPNGSTKIERTSGDGKVKEIAGTSVAHLKYNYGSWVNIDGSAGEWTQEIKVSGTNESEWTKTYNDVNGHPVKIEYSDGAVAIQSYNLAGQLVSGSADGVQTLYAYNNRGELETTCIDINQNGVIDFGGTDRITKTLRSVVSAHGTIVNRTVTQVYASATPTTVSTVDVSVDGLKTWNTQFGATTTTETVYSLDQNGNRNGAWTVTTTNPDGTQKVQSYAGGRLACENFLASDHTTVVASTSYAYDDPFGRLSSRTDSRTGTTSYTYDAKDRVLTTTTPAIAGGTASLLTTNTYDDIANSITVTLPDGSQTVTINDLNGKVKSTSGSQTYPVEYAYDGQGRMLTMTTHGASGAEVTTWNYDSKRGWLSRKVYPDSKATTYTYTPGGRLLTRTWARQPGGQALVTTYGYNSAGDLTSTLYSDNTPAVAITYNRLGQKLTSGNGVSATTYGYDANFRLTSEANTGVVNRTLTRSYDILGRATGIAVLSGTTPEHQIAYAYDTAGRLATVTQGSGSNAKTFSYGYEPNSAKLISMLTGPALTGTIPVITATNTWEPTRDVLAAKENRHANGNVVSRYDYIVNSLGQRTSVQQSGPAFAGNAFNLYGYDSMGQLTNASRYTGGTLDNPQNPVADQQFGFSFDTIGNRLSGSNGTTSTSYAPNTLNQYSAIQSGTSAAVTPTYDEDGNTLTDGSLTNQWDGENRLVSITKADGTIVTCAYDAQSRRVRKTVTSGSTVLSDRGFVYDDWNPVAEYSLTTTAGTATATLAAANTWGIDMSGSLQGAGGVGGLLSRTMNGAMYVYTYDGNGNVSDMLDAAGLAAHYEYGPFGEPIRATGVMAQSNPFRFSTKYTDDETALLYYGFRYYSPTVGRWLSRDPMEENGGEGLYVFAANDAGTHIDLYGLKCETASASFTHGLGNLTIPAGMFMQVDGAVNFSVTLSGKVCDCCDKTKKTIQEEGTISGRLSAEVGITFGKRINQTWGGINFMGFAGVRFAGIGGGEVSGKYSNYCDGTQQAQISGKLVSGVVGQGGLMLDAAYPKGWPRRLDGPPWGDRFGVGVMAEGKGTFTSGIDIKCTNGTCNVYASENFDATLDGKVKLGPISGSYRLGEYSGVIANNVQLGSFQNPFTAKPK